MEIAVIDKLTTIPMTLHADGEEFARVNYDGSVVINWDLLRKSAALFDPGNFNEGTAIARLVHEAVAAEREACAKIVEKLASADCVYPAGIQILVDAIRARGQQKV